MVWYSIGVYIINRTLHGRLEIQNFSSRVAKTFHSFAALTREIFFNTREKFRISARPCNILYLYSFAKSSRVVVIVKTFGSLRNIVRNLPKSLGRFWTSHTFNWHICWIIRSIIRPIKHCFENNIFSCTFVSRVTPKSMTLNNCTGLKNNCFTGTIRPTFFVFPLRITKA